ncbi:MAG: glucose-6-phosphate isomerase [Alphaproteobacteria bacterium]|nr:glucose-6-phosphate isomerase [Alphaproteobacteria bacterium]MBU1517026.1 glucose-6-phosphate isomerase [Alphaproteobacteria bacterium]MBU2093645.1 glucose-6-phosphate isomerase [Alphaproteobacteria bacterium]MBU2152509.1 glucose-6-phosphate isomerase [Alphaproteobacteria bacterium]MBU2308755.1 glucose-6-phosphate isomerase [Alphaproteobacteria bacterium]
MSKSDAAWAALSKAGEAARERRIDGLFAAEPDRLTRLGISAAGLEIDLSKQPWSLADLATMLDLAKASDIEAARSRLFAGEIVNASEGRPALHMALRAPQGSDFRADGVPVSADVETTRAGMAAFAEAVRSGAKTGATGKPFRAIVHIGIGGSDLGPRLIWEALKPLDPQIELRFVANVDPAELAQALTGLDPAETMIVTVSKTFTTLETLTNAEAARAWLRASLGVASDSHLVAVSAAPEKAQAFGVPADQVFGFWDWVGGRYSIWSSVGLSCAVALGYDAFARMLAGARAMDEHFETAPLTANAPVLLALAHMFNRNGLDRPIRAVVPYAQRLRLFAAFLQQLEMESNGKRVTAQGQPAPHATATSVFGDAGTNGQHAFFQLLHQGVDIVPVDILAVREGAEGDPTAQTKLLANAIAQAEALMVGRTEVDVRAELTAAGRTPAEIDALAPQRTFPGNRPTSFILLDRLDPERMGALVALYEHKTFVEGVLWGINSFDQWGVELGKSLATRVLGELEGGPAGAHDPSTAALIARLRS